MTEVTGDFCVGLGLDALDYPSYSLRELVVHVSTEESDASRIFIP